jgi:hypothetical protein
LALGGKLPKHRQLLALTFGQLERTVVQVRTEKRRNWENIKEGDKNEKI